MPPVTDPTEEELRKLSDQGRRQYLNMSALSQTPEERRAVYQSLLKTQGVLEEREKEA